MIMPEASLLQMSSATEALLARARKIVPPLLQKFHKGQLGRIAVVGGSEDYTGAPYFSAMASARLGCDMSHVICTPAAAAVIKTYSPNLMVHPLMRQSTEAAGPDEADPAKVAGRIVKEVLPRLHVLVVGPGLGRDGLMLATAARVVRAARDAGLPVVLDADALRLVQDQPEIVRGYRLAVLTPNVAEMARLRTALGLPDGTGAEALARSLGGPTVVQKGAHDYVSDGEASLVVDLPGGRKRSGGQGDTLTGSIATFLAWRKAYLDRIWDVDPDLQEDELVRLAAFAGCAVTRECSRLAFAKKGRSLQASDLTDEVYQSYLNLFGRDEDDPAAAR